MATYLQRYELVNDTKFKQRLQMALWIAAVSMLQDAGASAQRKSWARDTLRGEASTDVVQRMAVLCAATDAIGNAGAGALDSDIQTAVSQIANLLAPA